MAKPAQGTTAATQWRQGCGADLGLRILLEIDAIKFRPGGTVHLHLGLEIAGLYRLPADHLFPAGSVENL